MSGVPPTTTLPQHATEVEDQAPQQQPWEQPQQVPLAGTIPILPGQVPQVEGQAQQQQAIPTIMQMMASMTVEEQRQTMNQLLAAFQIPTAAPATTAIQDNRVGEAVERIAAVAESRPMAPVHEGGGIPIGLPKLTFPTFDGNEDEDVEGFLSHCESKFVAANLTDPHRQTAYVSDCLRGTAKSWYYITHRQHRDTVLATLPPELKLQPIQVMAWPEFKAKLCAAFPPEFFRSNVLKDLSDLHLRQGDSLKEHIRRFEQLVTKIRVDKDRSVRDLIGNLCSGLRQQAALAVYAAYPTGAYDSVVPGVAALRAFAEAQLSAETRIGRKEEHQDDSEQHQPRGPERQARFAPVRDRYQALGSTSNITRDVPMTTAAAVTTTQPRGYQQRQQQPRSCHECGSYNHMFRDCPRSPYNRERRGFARSIHLINLDDDDEEAQAERA